MSLSLSHWYPGSGVVLDCIDSCSLHPYLLLYLVLFGADHLFRKKISGIPSVSNSLDPDPARHYVGPDLGPNCLQRLSADITCRQGVKIGVIFGKVNYRARKASTYMM